MRAAKIIGKRIVAVRQHRTGKECNVPGIFNVDAIVLEDGTLLIPLVTEGESEFFVDFALRYSKPKEVLE